jgi:hypothetical protein
MTPEAQRIAIAEACGWSLQPGQTARTPKGDEVWTYDSRGNSYGPYTIEGMLQTAAMKMVPDYLNDLDAIHEAEKILTDDQCQRHVDNLELVTGATLSTNGVRYGMNYFCLYHATAAQRAEAFLRTLGLWKENTTS